MHGQNAIMRVAANIDTVHRHRTDGCQSDGRFQSSLYMAHAV